MDISQRMTKAFDNAADVTKQLITLATAIMGGFVAFVKSDHQSSLDFTSWGSQLPVAFALLAASIACGVAVQMQITGQLGSAKIPKPDPYTIGIRIFASAQALLFLSGTCIFVLGVPRWRWPW